MSTGCPELEEGEGNLCTALVEEGTKAGLARLVLPVAHILPVVSVFVADSDLAIRAKGGKA